MNTISDLFKFESILSCNQLEKYNSIGQTRSNAVLNSDSKLNAINAMTHTHIYISANTYMHSIYRISLIVLSTRMTWFNHRRMREACHRDSHCLLSSETIHAIHTFIYIHKGGSGSAVITMEFQHGKSTRVASQVNYAFRRLHSPSSTDTYIAYAHTQWRGSDSRPTS